MSHLRSNVINLYKNVSIYSFFEIEINVPHLEIYETFLNVPSIKTYVQLAGNSRNH